MPVRNKSSRYTYTFNKFRVPPSRSFRFYRNNNFSTTNICLALAERNLHEEMAFSPYKVKIYNWLLANVLRRSRNNRNFWFWSWLQQQERFEKFRGNRAENYAILLSSFVFPMFFETYEIELERSKKYEGRSWFVIEEDRRRSVINLKIWIMIRFKSTY